MRLRIRTPGAPPVKLEAEDGSSLAQLRSTVREALGLAPEADVVLSFNNKDPLSGGPDDPVRNLGVRSGDLLWLLSPAEPALPRQAAAAATAADPPAMEPEGKRARGITPPAAVSQPPQPQPSQQQEQAQDLTAAASAAAAADKGKGAATEEPQRMAVDGAGGEEECADPVPPSQRLPAYLLRTLRANCGASTQPADMLLLAAHAAMLETGFLPSWAAETVGSGSSSGSANSAYQLPPSCRVSSSICKVQYTLMPSNGSGDGGASSSCSSSSIAVIGQAPAAGGRGQQHAQAAGPACSLQCSRMGGGVVLAVTTGQHARHLSLHAPTFIHQHSSTTTTTTTTAAAAAAAAAASVWAEAGGVASSSGRSARDSPASPSPAPAAPSLPGAAVQLLPGGGLAVGAALGLHLEPAAIKQLWTRLKDGLAFPMLLAAYAEAGLQPPAGLLALPEELKQRVLEALRPQDLAALSGACSELRHLASQDALWRPLFEREFPHAAPYYTSQAQHRGFKWALGQCWRERRQREEALRRARHRMFVPAVPRFGLPRPSFYPPAPPPGFPGIIGGDFDRLPQFGPGTGLPGQFGGAGVGFMFGGGRRQGRGSGLGGFRMH